MPCSRCGANLADDTQVCRSCGQTHSDAEPDQSTANGRVSGRAIGFSQKINDPAFANYLQNSNRWSAIFSLILAVLAVVGFSLTGETGASDLENPQALLIGLAIGGMFVIIALVQIRSRNNSRTWDGQVVDKKIEQRQRRKSGSGDDHCSGSYQLYTVFVRSESGKTYRITAEDDDTVYNYYHVGDRVRHHAGLNSYEKYDKSQDVIIFCNACATLNEISSDYCVRCRCPLLK